MLAPTRIGMELGPRPERVLLEQLRLEQRDRGARWLLQHIDLGSGDQEQQKNYTRTAAHRTSATQGHSWGYFKSLFATVL